MKTTHNTNSSETRIYNVIRQKDGTDYYKLVARMRAKKSTISERYSRISKSEWFRGAYHGMSIKLEN